MTHKDQEAAEAKYGGNGWSEVEKLVLYRLDVCEANICGVKDDLAAFSEKRDSDVQRSRDERAAQFGVLHEELRGIREAYAEAAVKRADSQKLRIEKESELTKEMCLREQQLQAGQTLHRC